MAGFLIMLGIEFIVTKLYYDYNQQEVQLSPSGISIVLAIVILFTSSLWTNTGFNISNFNWSFNNTNWNYNYEHIIEELYKPDVFEVSETKKLVINNARGSIDIQASNDNVLKIEAAIRFATNN